MVKVLVKCMKICMITLLTIVANQEGNRVPDRTAVIRKISNAISELNALSKAMEDSRNEGIL